MSDLFGNHIVGGSFGKSGDGTVYETNRFTLLPLKNRCIYVLNLIMMQCMYIYKQ